MPESLQQKIIRPEQTGTILSDTFRKKHTVAFTNGCFDILHRGHIHYLSRAREMADLLIVGLNSDHSVRRIKGPDRPVNDQQSRAEILASLFFVDYVIIFNEDTPLKLIQQIKPDLLVKGGDYKPEEIVGYEDVTSSGGRVETIPLLKGFSSSDILNHIRNLKST
jgi:D-beta-D-heptose 7-phosphate kinase/D-beta-D-heptose 1-phosphate adenosyltransferase